MDGRLFLRIAVLSVLMSLQAGAQTAPDTERMDLAVLRGLAPVSALLNTDAGRLALSKNYLLTRGIQSGVIPQPMLLPFALQQEQALRDTFIANSNLADLADGLGTTLGAAYLARAHCIEQKNCIRFSQSTEKLIEYSSGITLAHAGLGKFFFANVTTDGTLPGTT